MSDAVQYDLFGEALAREDAERAVADRAAARRAWRAEMELDCCTGAPCPPGRPGAGYPQGVPQVRCGRCGEFTFAYGMVINHDLGWMGCPGPGPAAAYRQFADAEEMSRDRHDNLHHPRCGRPGCGHAWGIHVVGGWGNVPQEDAACYSHCGCPGYLRPAERSPTCTT